MTSVSMSNAKDLVVIISNLLWPAILIVVLFQFRLDLQALMRTLIARVKSGSSLKISTFEVGAIRIESGTAPKIANGAIVTTPDRLTEFRDARAQFRQREKTVFLVHRLFPSQDPKQIFDVVIFVTAGKDYGSLLAVDKVEYYLGPHWDNEVFESHHRMSSFALSTSAFYPFTASAKVYFVDQTVVTIHRYVDFEMGPRA